MSLKFPVGALESFKKKLQENGIDIHKKWLILHAGVSEEKRQYPSELFGKAGKLLVESGFQVVLTGSQSERLLTESIQNIIGEGSYVAAGDFTLEEFIALISIVPVMLSVNTGPVHIAAAFQRPVVDLYALTNPQHTPWMTPSKVLYYGVPEDLKNNDSTLIYIEKYMKNLPHKYPDPQEIVKAVLDLYSP
jgi:ADP-heptose:LPS heptosyltransferase